MRLMRGRSGVTTRKIGAVERQNRARTDRVSFGVFFERSVQAVSPARAAATVPMTSARVQKEVRGVATKASAVELMQVANQGAEIASVATTCFAITLVGLAIGFVLLRVEGSVMGEE